MSLENTPLQRRDFSSVDAKRSATNLVVLAVVATSYWFVLPGVQRLILPRATGGVSGPWVIRPINAFHWGAMVVLSAVTMQLICGPLRRRYRKEDAALGTRYDPYHGRHAALYIKAGLLLVLYAAALAFYLFSWTGIGPGGIDEHFPWTIRHHPFPEIAALETNSTRARSWASPGGPEHSIRLQSGRTIEFSLDNEGVTTDDLDVLTKFISSQTGLAWQERSDPRGR